MRILARGLIRIKKGRKFLAVADLFNSGLQVELAQLSKFHSQDECDAISQHCLKHLGSYLANQDNWRLGLRYQLAESVLWMASYGALIINPEPEPDLTGFRGAIGVTGKLRDKLLHIYRSENFLPQYKFNHDPDFNELYHTTFLFFQTARTIANCWNWARWNIEGKTEPDWFRPFVATCLAAKEDDYRRLIGLPSELERSHKLNALAPLHFQTAWTFVVDGSQNPHQKWLNSL